MVNPDKPKTIRATDIEILKGRRLIIEWLEKTNLEFFMTDGGRLKNGGLSLLAEHVCINKQTTRQRYIRYIEKYREAKPLKADERDATCPFFQRLDLIMIKLDRRMNAGWSSRKTLPAKLNSMSASPGVERVASLPPQAINEGVESMVEDVVVEQSASPEIRAKNTVEPIIQDAVVVGKSSAVDKEGADFVDVHALKMRERGLAITYKESDMAIKARELMNRQKLMRMEIIQAGHAKKIVIKGYLDLFEA